MRIVILCENCVAEPGPLLAEHGFACLIEAHGRRLLFDTGQGRTLLHNADQLGVDLANLDAVVLSHGHYDHTGGLPELLRRSPGLKVHYHPQAFQPRCAVGPARNRDVGVPFTEDQIAGLGGIPEPAPDPVQLSPGIWLSGEVPRVTAFETGDPQLHLGHADHPATDPDPVRDDLSLAVVTPEGLVVIAGCAHAGLVNILLHLRGVTGVDRVHAVIGGTHLGPATDHRFRQTLAELEGFDIARLGLSHCTGLHRSAELCRLWPERAFLATVGRSIVF